MAIERIRQHGSPAASVLWRRLQDLPAILSTTTHLRGFSLTVSDQPLVLGFWIPRPRIASMVERLSRTCIALEIDTRGHDYAGPGSAHLCDALRTVLPHLQHLRLRLSTLCPAVFGLGFRLDGTTPDESPAELTPAPMLQTAVINGATRLPGCGGPAHVCGTFQEEPHRAYQHIPDAREALVKCLRLLTERGNYPAIQRLWLLDKQVYEVRDPSLYSTYNRRDLVTSKTWAVPFRNIRAFDKDSILARTPEGQEVLSYEWAVEALAEGEAWRETLGGSRFPAAWLATDDFRRDGFVPRPLPTISVDSYRAQFPKRMCHLWANERKTGRRLLNAVEREGLVDASSLPEMTPPGWSRDENGDLNPDHDEEDVAT